MVNKRVLHAIKEAHRKDAIIYITQQFNNPKDAKKFAEQIGQITSVSHTERNTKYVYEAANERIKIIGFARKKVDLSKEQTQNDPINPMTTRKKQLIDRVIEQSYEKDAEFIIILPLAKNRKEALQKIKPFAVSKRPSIKKGGKFKLLEVDDLPNQILATVAMENANT